MFPQTFRDKTWQPWGFEAVSREAGEFFGDSRNFFVNPNHVQATDLGNTGENPQVPLATIEAAVALCRPYSGDTIYVMSNDGWVYGTATQNPIQESVTIPATKPGIRLIGVGIGTIGVFWQPENAGETCLTIEAIDVTIENFAFFGNGAAANGIYAEWNGATKFGENVKILNCFFDNDIDIAIQLEYAWFNEIAFCYFESCDTYGIYADVAGSGTAYNKIHHNRFRDCAAAMTLNDCDDSEIYANSVYNGNAQGGGLATDEGIALTGGSSNQVHDNYFSCLLPVPANGDYDDLNTASATDAWINNHCLDGDTVTNPT